MFFVQPHGWFHIVLNMEPSIAITHNYVSEVNMYSVMQFLDQQPENVSGVSSGVKHLLGAKFRSALREHRAELLEALEAREAKARAPSKWEVAKGGEAFSLLG